MPDYFLQPRPTSHRPAAAEGHVTDARQRRAPGPRHSNTHPAMSLASFAGEFEIPASAEEQLRRDIERELDLNLTAPTRVGASFVSPPAKPHTRPGGGRRAAPVVPAVDSDVSSESDAEPPAAYAAGLRSPGNHSILLATPRGMEHSAHRRRRAQLSRSTSERLNIAQLARAGWGDGAEPASPAHSPPRLPRNARRPQGAPGGRAPGQPGSRHSSSDTAVDSPPRATYTKGGDPAAAAAPLPESVLWADQQLGSLVHCIQQMEGELTRLKGSAVSSAALRELRARVETLEDTLERQGAELLQLQREFRHAADGVRTAREPPAAAWVDAVVEQLAARLEGVRPSKARAPRPASPPSPPPSAGASPTISRLFDELGRMSAALEQLQREALGRSAPMPPTPPREPVADDSSLVHDADWTSRTVQERYEQVCRAVADALGVHPTEAPRAERGTPSGTRKKSRKERIRSAMQQREAADAAAEALLQRLTDADARMETPVLSAHEVRVLEHLFDEHRHEFLQQKRLYSELADELKRMEPSMDKTKRRILAEHVHESIDALEAEATRINELHAHLVRCQRRTR